MAIVQSTLDKNHLDQYRIQRQFCSEWESDSICRKQEALLLHGLGLLQDRKNSLNQQPKPGSLWCKQPVISFHWNIRLLRLCSRFHLIEIQVTWVLGPNCNHYLWFDGHNESEDQETALRAQDEWILQLPLLQPRRTLPLQCGRLGRDLSMGSKNEKMRWQDFWWRKFQHDSYCNESGWL